jgi:pSer/pThr/pTyr-binding forkhead associated (FHA) protein
MDDGRTRRVERTATGGGGQQFLSRYQAAVVMTSGDAAGSEFALEQETVVIGRGPGVDVAFDDSSLSRKHAALELTQDGFRLRDLGSTNGMVVNGSAVDVADLKHGDRFELGTVSFQYVLRERSRTQTYVLPES